MTNKQTKIYDNAGRVIAPANINGDLAGYCLNLVETIKAEAQKADAAFDRWDIAAAAAAMDNAAAAYKRLPDGACDPYRIATQINCARKHIGNTPDEAKFDALCLITGGDGNDGVIRSCERLVEYGLGKFAANAVATAQARDAAWRKGDEPPYIINPDPLAIYDERVGEYWRRRGGRPA